MNELDPSQTPDGQPTEESMAVEWAVNFLRQSPVEQNPISVRTSNFLEAQNKENDVPGESMNDLIDKLFDNYIFLQEFMGGMSGTSFRKHVEDWIDSMECRIDRVGTHGRWTRTFLELIDHENIKNHAEDRLQAALESQSEAPEGMELEAREVDKWTDLYVVSVEAHEDERKEEMEKLMNNSY